MISIGILLVFAVNHTTPKVKADGITPMTQIPPGLIPLSSPTAGTELKPQSIATKPFGGQIINEESLQIQFAKEINFTCHVAGKTITIKPVGGSPAEYYIPTTLLKSGLKKGSWILGKYMVRPYMITCIFDGFPPSTTMVSLKEITMYGTSK